MKTAEKPKIEVVGTYTLKVPTYGEAVAREKKKMPTIMKELKEINKVKKGSKQWAIRRKLGLK